MHTNSEHFFPSESSCGKAEKKKLEKLTLELHLVDYVDLLQIEDLDIGDFHPKRR